MVPCVSTRLHSFLHPSTSFPALPRISLRFQKCPYPSTCFQSYLRPSLSFDKFPRVLILLPLVSTRHHSFPRVGARLHSHTFGSARINIFRAYPCVFLALERVSARLKRTSESFRAFPRFSKLLNAFPRLSTRVRMIRRDSICFHQAPIVFARFSATQCVSTRPNPFIFYATTSFGAILSDSWRFHELPSVSALLRRSQ